MRYDAIFFDFDGVLAETAAIKTQAMYDVFIDHGKDVADAMVARHKQHEGVSRLVKIRWGYKEYLGIDLTDEELAVQGARYTAMVEDKVVRSDWVAGAQGLLEKLKGKMLTFVITGTPHEEILRIIEGRAMGMYFTSVYGSPPSKAPKVRELLARHDLDPARCLFIGDAMTDHDAAHETGVPFLGRVAPGHPDPFPAGTRTIPDLSHVEV